MRLLIFLALCILLYYLVKSYFKGKSRPKTGNARHRQPPGRRSRSQPPAPITDQLVKDPVCGVYTPKRDAFPLIWKGEAYYFCSEECREKFRQQKGAAKRS